MRAGVITVSTSKAAGEGVDESGPLLAELAESLGARVAARELLGDDRAAIEACLLALCDEQRLSLILTTGGTGLSPDDVTPEATRAVLERELPGIPEAIRAIARPHTPHWMLSRPAAGVRGQTLIVNLPGSPKAIAQSAEELRPALAHALVLIAGTPHAHG
ncbi:MAG: MogA/MoaB family molybdenum cofactor biosynthesis protein [Solirubrobacteraceae bacterium]